MGSPAINLVEAALQAEPAAVRIGDATWPLTSAQAISLAGRDTVVLGLRPDAFRWPAPGDGPAVTVTALGVESLGNERHILFQALGPGPVVAAAADGTESLWTAKVDASCHLTIGEQVTLGVDMRQAHFFDAKTGLALPIS
jgi:multiple sugar transport system ATP-binding protein